MQPPSFCYLYVTNLFSKPSKGVEPTHSQIKKGLWSQISNANAHTTKSLQHSGITLKRWKENVCLCPPKNLQLLRPPCSLKPSLALTAGQGRRGVKEGKILGYRDINLHVSFLLCVQEVGSGAMRLLAPVSLGMPACSPEEIEEIGLAPPEATRHPHHQLFFSLPFSLSHPLCLSWGNHKRVLHIGAKRGGFRGQRSMICRRTEDFSLCTRQWRAAMQHTSHL